MFLTKAGQIGKALCAEYKKNPLVMETLALLEKGAFGIALSYDKDNEAIVYEAYSRDSTPNESRYIYLEVAGDGKAVEHIDRNSSFVGLLAEQKALYVYLYEKEMKASMSELTEIYKPIANLIKPILPLSSSQIEKRARIRKDFLAFIKVDEKKKAKEEEEEKYTPLGKIEVALTFRQIIDENKFTAEIVLNDEDDKSIKIENLKTFISCFVNGEVYKFRRYSLMPSPEVFDETSLEILKFFVNVCNRRQEYNTSTPVTLSISQVAKLLNIVRGKYVHFGSDQFYVDSEMHQAGYKVLPTEELEFQPPLRTVEMFRSFVNSEYIILLDKGAGLIEVYKFANETMGKVYAFFLEHKDVDLSAIKDIIFEKIPLEYSLNGTMPKEENRLRIALYLDMNEEGHITFRTIYSLFGEIKDRDEFDDNYYYKATLSAFDKELENVGGLENGALKDQDKILKFLQQDLTKLKSIADVLLSEKLQNAKVRRPDSFSVSIRNNINWLSVSIKSKQFSAEEISKILDSYKKKKKYVLLRGDYILLKDEDLSTASEIKESVKMDNKMEVEEQPIYEAFKLLALEEEGTKIEFNEFVGQIVDDISNFKEAEISLTKEVKRVVRPYQEAGIKWLSVLHKYRLGGILADDMGLGKTLEVISFLEGLSEDKPSLIIAPKSVIYNWLSEFKRWAPELEASVIDGTKDERIKAIAKIKNNKKSFFITSYDSLRNDEALYKNKQFEILIVDEAQYIKNGAALKSKAVRALNASSRFALTGTPIENSMADLWAIFDFLMPGYLDSFNIFKTRYILAGDQVKARASLSKKITPFLLRRTKAEVLKDLPKKTTEIITITMNDEARRYYDAILIDTRNKIKQKREDPTKGDKYSEKGLFSVLPLLTRLREVCVDPSAFLDGFSEESAKMMYALSYISVALEAGHKVLVFSSFTKVLDHLSLLLKEAGTKSYYIYGGVEADDRLSMAESFNTKNDVNVMLVSLKAGGTGLNLHGADIVLHLDPWWNVAAEEQATDRAYRIGQKRPVSVVKLICHNSIEEKVVQLQENKRELYNQVIKSGDEAISRLNIEDIKFLLS
ncbi:MAG: SNF2 helicase associated domain-containing protein [Bacilli bacterium]|nr:SNF2 helicase associated domain-containing protein [Bacilli bacterium]